MPLTDLAARLLVPCFLRARGRSRAPPGRCPIAAGLRVYMACPRARRRWLGRGWRAVCQKFNDVGRSIAQSQHTGGEMLCP